MRSTEDIGLISVCTDCMLAHANGDVPEREPGEPEPWALLTFGYTPAMGGEHRENCTEADRGEGCDCDYLGFSMTQCEGCGSRLDGERYWFTMFRSTSEYANDAARRALRAARVARSVGDRKAFLGSLRRAAEWRTYLTTLTAEQRREARWFASQEADRASRVTEM